MSEPLSSEQMREVKTNPDYQEQLEKMAERVRLAIYGDDDGLEDMLDDVAATEIGLSPTEVWDVADDEHGKWLDAREQILVELRLELKPMIVRILTDGDWRVG